MNSSLVSICIPVYNGEKHLRACLDSALAQTHSPTEIIIVDDRSSDRSEIIVKEYLQKESRIKYFFVNEKNLGLVGNWNRCLELATGEWIKFLFQDDLLSSHCIGKMMNGAESHHPFVVCGRNFLIEEDADPGLKKYFEKGPVSLADFYPGKKTVSISPVEISRLAVRFAGRNFIGEPVCTLFNKSVMKQAGHFDPQFSQICDLEYWLRMAGISGIQFIPEKLVTFRVHGKSTTTFNLSKKDSKFIFADEILLADKLINHPQFKKFRKSLPPSKLLRLKEYLKVRILESNSFIRNNKLSENDFPEIKKLMSNPSFLKYRSGTLSTKIIHSLIKLKRQFRS